MAYINLIPPNTNPKQAQIRTTTLSNQNPRPAYQDTKQYNGKPTKALNALTSTPPMVLNHKDCTQQHQTFCQHTPPVALVHCTAQPHTRFKFLNPHCCKFKMAVYLHTNNRRYDIDVRNSSILQNDISLCGSQNIIEHQLHCHIQPYLNYVWSKQVVFLVIIILPHLCKYDKY